MLSEMRSMSSGFQTSLMPAWNRIDSEILLPRLRDQNDKVSCSSFFRVMNRICYSGFAKSLESQETGIAFAAGETFGCRIVTTVGE